MVALCFVRPVVRGITPGWAAALRVAATGGTGAAEKTAVEIVVLPGALADRVWKGSFQGQPRVFVAAAPRGPGSSPNSNDETGGCIELVSAWLRVVAAVSRRRVAAAHCLPSWARVFSR